MQQYSINDVLFFDVETTGLPPKNANYETDFKVFPHIVQMAWIFGDTEKKFIILPDGWTIPTEATLVHGITTEQALKEGTPLADVLSYFLFDAEQSYMVCAHNIYFDTSIIKANWLRLLGGGDGFQELQRALDKSKRIDTMSKSIKFVGACYPNGRPGKWPKLEELFNKCFEGETFAAHDALEDCKALKRCLPVLVENGIIELIRKEYPAEQLTTEKEIPKTPIGQLDINPEPQAKTVIIPPGTDLLNNDLMF